MESEGRGPEEMRVCYPGFPEAKGAAKFAAWGLSPEASSFEM